MSGVINVFQKLGVDESVFTVFILVIVLYFVLKHLFFESLLFVITNRENKTTKLEGLANKKFQEAEQMSAKYKEQIDEAQNSNFERLKGENKKLTDYHKTEYKKFENEMNKDFEKKVSEYQEELDSNKNKVMAHSEELSQLVLDKFSH
jgi:F0F1-type ATP synthase membrane subunit b/b'